MTNPLDILKEHLQNALNDDEQFEGYSSALSDAIYSCSLGSVTALEEWMSSWTLDSPTIYNLSDEEKDYYEGVGFVEQQWHQITGMF